MGFVPSFTCFSSAAALDYREGSPSCSFCPFFPFKRHTKIFLFKSLFEVYCSLCNYPRGDKQHFLDLNHAVGVARHFLHFLFFFTLLSSVISEYSPILIGSVDVGGVCSDRRSLCIPLACCSTGVFMVVILTPPLA